MVAGLNKLINNDPSSFSSGDLISPFIVLHPVEFLFSILRKYETNVTKIYGVDLIRAKIELERKLKDTVRAGIKPIFIYNGLKERSYIDLKSKAKYNAILRNKFDAAKFDVPSSECSNLAEFMPVSRDLAVNCLHNLGFNVVATDYDWMPCALGVALYLDCPIAAMSSDFYLCSRPANVAEELRGMSINELRYIPLVDDLYTIEDKGGKDRITLKFYRPENSPLKVVPVLSRPLIGILMNSFVISKLPNVIKVEPSDTESYNEAKLRAVVDYVSKNNPIHVLKKVMEFFVNSSCADQISKAILSYLELFYPDFYEASQVLTLLGLNKGLPTITPSRRGKKSQYKENLSPSLFFGSAAKILKGTGHESKPLDFFYRWPKGLIDMYRSGRLEKVYLASIYDKVGVTLFWNNEYIIELPHCFGPSRVLRALVYALLVGIDEGNGARFKLAGLNPTVKELCYEGMFRFKTYNVHVQPLYLPNNCSPDDFLDTVLGFQCTSDIPDWSKALVVTVLLWHQQRPGHAMCQISECPLILSLLVLTLVTRQTRESDLPALADHLDTLKTEVKAEMAESNSSPSPALEKEFLHAALELEIIYNNYITLYNLLNVLRNPNAKPDFNSPVFTRFPPSHMVFPSFELLVFMACHLRSQVSPLDDALRTWLVRAFRSTLNNLDAIGSLIEAVATFISIIKSISTTKLNFQEPKVDISDPPRFFIPSEEQTNRHHNDGPGKNRESFTPRRNSGAKIPHSGAVEKEVKPNIDRKSSGTNKWSRKPSSSYAKLLAQRVGDMKLDSP